MDQCKLSCSQKFKKILPEQLKSLTIVCRVKKQHYTHSVKELLLERLFL